MVWMDIWLRHAVTTRSDDQDFSMQQLKSWDDSSHLTISLTCDSGCKPTWHGSHIHLCVCVSWPLEEGGYLYVRDTNRKDATPSNTCDVITPPDSSHQPLPGEMLANGCRSGRRRWDSDCKPRWDGSMVTFWHPAWCVTLWLLGAVSLSLAFLALSDFRRDVSRTISVTIHNALRYWLRQSWAKLRRRLKQNNSHIRRLRWSNGCKPLGRCKHCHGEWQYSYDVDGQEDPSPWRYHRSCWHRLGELVEIPSHCWASWYHAIVQ